MTKIALLFVAITGTVTLTGCWSDADTVSRNISEDADYFRIPRRIVFYNGITDKYILAIEGFCSIFKDNQDQQLEVTCKTGNKEYKKHYLGVSDNVTYFAEQIEGANVSPNYHKVIFKPQEIIPDIEIKLK